LLVYAQLSPLTSYTWIITDKFDNEYTGELITDADGFWSIPVDELPPGLLTEFSGVFKLQVIDSGCKPIKFKVAGEYDCIQFEVKGGTREKNNLGCNFDCISTGGTETGIFPFSNVSSLTIDWTSQLNDRFGNNLVVHVYHQISPGIFQVVDVTIQHNTDYGGNLTSIFIDNAGPATGYVLIS